MMHHLFTSSVLLAVSAIARVLAQESPPPKPSGSSSVLNVTMLIPAYRTVESIYGRVITVQSGLTTIGLDCHSATEWVNLEPCRLVPQSASIIMASPTSGTMVVGEVH